jgi:large subunit ribosomal protein L6
MSRIGNQPIQIPNGVSIEINGPTVSVRGPKGNLTNVFDFGMDIKQEDDVVKVMRPTDESQDKAFHGLTRSLLANMITGVSNGFSKELELVGVGYRVQQKGKGITLSVMLSHTVDIEPPEGVKLKVEGNNQITVSGIDKQAVGQLAAEIRKVRPPNAYTGKGVRYSGEIVRLKPGKSARRT